MGRYGFSLPDRSSDYEDDGNPKYTSSGDMTNGCNCNPDQTTSKADIFPGNFDQTSINTDGNDLILIVIISILTIFLLMSIIINIYLWVKIRRQSNKSIEQRTKDHLLQ